jgi:GT2 family glycosyltransferase
MGSSPEVSVVVPVFNGEKTIAACVRSLLALEYPRERLEILVVDNQSTDATRDRLREFGTAIQVLAEPTRGASAARNCGVRAARGRIVAFTDADCRVDRAWLSHLVAPLADPAVGISGGTISSDGTGRIERFGEIVHDHRRAIEAPDAPYVVTMNWASRRDVLLEAGLFDERLLRSQDVDLSYRIHDAGYRMVYTPDAIIWHRNERHLAGLLREGYVHGRYGVPVAMRSGRMTSTLGQRLRRYARRHRRHVTGMRRGSLVEGGLASLFELGRMAGEIVARGRLSIYGQRRALRVSHREPVHRP